MKHAYAFGFLFESVAGNTRLRLSRLPFIESKRKKKNVVRIYIVMLVRRNLEFLTKYEPIRKGKIEGVSYIYIYIKLFISRKRQKGEEQGAARETDYIGRRTYDDIKKFLSKVRLLEKKK